MLSACGNRLQLEIQDKKEKFAYTSKKVVN